MSGLAFLYRAGRYFSMGSKFLATTWIPEGLLITPRSSHAPYGYGFPKRTPGRQATINGVVQLTGGELINPPFGTAIASEAKECMNQALINRFPNNKYLDKPGFITGLSETFKLPAINVRLRDSIETEVKTRLPQFVSWPLAYTPRSDTISFWNVDANRLQWIDEPGENSWYCGLIFKSFKRPTYGEGAIVGAIPGRQFDENCQSLIYETESLFDWHCHWPEELLYDNAAFEEIFRMTNEYRAAVGLAPLVREVRGPVNYARMILSEMQRAGIQFHENETKYRPGTGTFLDRFYNGGGIAVGLAENLISGINGQFSIAAGNAAADAWRHSPGHYANMISAQWTEDGYCTSLDVFTAKATITESGPPHPELFDPIVSGTSFAQNFVQRQQWLYAGPVGNTNSRGRVSFLSRYTPIGMPYSLNCEFVAYQGRLYTLQPIVDLKDDEVEVYQLGGTTFIKNGVPYLRVLFMRKTGDLSWVFMAYILSTKDLAADWELEAESSPFDHIATPSVSMATFTPDGLTGVFSTTRIVFTEAADFHLDSTLDHPAIRSIEQIAIQYADQSFTVLESVSGPEITYTVIDDEEDELQRYTQEVSGEIGLYPTYNTTGELVRLKQNISVFVEQEADNGLIEGKDEVNIHEYIVFPSEKTIITTNYHLLNKAFVDDAYFVIIHYLDLVNEDIVYSKIDCSIVGESIYGTLSIYVNDVVVKTLPSQIISDHEIAHRSIEYVPQGDNKLAVGIRDLSVTRSYVAQIDQYSVLPYGGIDGEYHFSSCQDYPAIKYYPGRLLEGTQNISLGGRDSNITYCYSGTHDNTNYFCASYNATLPIGAQCALARYKGRYVVQFSATGIFSFDIPEEERKFIYSNFDINTLVGIGDMNWISPIGVV